MHAHRPSILHYSLQIVAHAHAINEKLMISRNESFNAVNTHDMLTGRNPDMIERRLDHQFGSNINKK